MLATRFRATVGQKYHPNQGGQQRQRVSRLVRDTLSFSKKLAHHIGAIKYFICHYNLTRAAALPV
jgi:hypothetical protein